MVQTGWTSRLRGRPSVSTVASVHQTTRWAISTKSDGLDWGMPGTVTAQPKKYNYSCAMDLDLVTAVHLSGLALVAEALRRLHEAGFPDLRTSHGFVIQHVVDGPRPSGEMAE